MIAIGFVAVDISWYFVIGGAKTAVSFVVVVLVVAGVVVSVACATDDTWDGLVVVDGVEAVLASA